MFSINIFFATFCSLNRSHVTEHGSSTLKTKSFSFLLFILSNVCLSCLSDFICYQYNNNNGGTLENERERVFAELSLVSSLVCSQLPSCSRHLSLMDWLTTFDFQSVCSNYWLTELSFSTVDETVHTHLLHTM